MDALADRNLLFGLLALQTGMIDQAALDIAFQAWARDQNRSLAETLLNQGALDVKDLEALSGLAERHLERHGNDPGKSLDTFPAAQSLRQSLAVTRSDATVDLPASSTTARSGDSDVTVDLPASSTTAKTVDSEATGSFGGPIVPGRQALDSSTTTTRIGDSDGRRFRIIRPHARGGLGEVFVALDDELHREVALKQILDHHAGDDLSRTRFVLEAEITGGLEHPGIVPVYGMGQDVEGRPYYAMRFIRGDSLKEAIAGFHDDESLKTDPGQRSLALRKLLRRFVDVCNAIDYAHGRGVLHRDIKPANVIVGKHGETLVVDWGLAKPLGLAEPVSTSGERTLIPSSSSGSADTLPGSTLGTPAYMSPEQAAGDLDKLGPRSDVYSLGATLYSLLTNKPPFEGKNLAALLRDVQKGAFPPPRQLDPSIDRALEAVCLKAMATDPEGRHTTARALADDIEQWAADEPTSAWSEPFSVRARRWMRRNRTAVTASSVALLAILFGTAVVLAIQTRANAELKKSNDALNVANTSLASAKDREAARFALAKDAIRLFHGQVGDDLVLKEDQFKPLRDKLLRGAADFYGKLEELLQGQTDPASRKSLGQAYYDLGELTSTIGDKLKALETHRKALAIRRELAEGERASAEARADVARSLTENALLLRDTGKTTDALAVFAEAQAILDGLVARGQAVDEHRALLGIVLFRSGVLSSEKGDQAGAQSAFDRSVVVLTSLIEANPNVPRYRALLANCHSNLGHLQSQTGHRAEALESYRRSVAIQEELVKDNPSVGQYRSDLAKTHNNLGLLLIESGQMAESLRSSLRAVALHEGLARENPAVTQYRVSLAGNHQTVANSHFRMGHSTEALAACLQAVAILDGLARDNPKVPQYRYDLSRSHNSIGVLRVQSGQPAEAMESYRRSQALLEDLNRENAKVLQYPADLARIHQNIGVLLSSNGRPAEALVEQERAEAMFQALVDANPNIPYFKNSLASTLTNAGDALRALDRLEEATASYARAIAIREQLVQKDAANLTYRGNLAWSVRRLGLARRARDDVKGAVADARRALTLYEGLQSRSTEEWYELACCRASLAGLAGQAGSGLSAEDARLEASRAMDSLRRAVANGYRQVDAMNRETALDSLRERPDFRLLMDDLNFPANPFAR